MGAQVTIAANCIDKQRLGYQAISLTHFTDTSEPSIAAGSKVEVGGALYEFAADETGTGWAGIGASNTVYLYLVPAGAAISWLYSTTAPTWDTAKQGWYNGNNRAIFQLFKDSSGNYTGKRTIQNPFMPDIYYQFDLIIDSNAKLDQWCQAIAGQFKRVLIRAGTWTASALSPTAGVLVNLDNTGTVYVFAEKGSSINYSGSYLGNLIGLYHAAATSDMSLELFENLKVNITNTNVGASHAYGFKNCTNLAYCTAVATTNGTGSGYGFDGGVNLTSCTGTGTGGTSGLGFNSCNNLANCIGVGQGTGNGAGYGFSSCNGLSICTGTGTGVANGTGYGFNGCTRMTGCVGTGSQTGAGAGWGTGFNSCSGVINCAGQGLAAGAGNGYGFYACKKVQQCGASGASKTAIYNTSYADSAVANACADTAAGGYNS